jgi:hypothetical protein
VTVAPTSVVPNETAGYCDVWGERVTLGDLEWRERFSPWLADLECPRCGEISGDHRDCAPA